MSTKGVPRPGSCYKNVNFLKKRLTPQVGSAVHSPIPWEKSQDPCPSWIADLTFVGLAIERLALLTWERRRRA